MGISGNYLDGQTSTAAAVELSFDELGTLHLTPPVRPPMASAELRMASQIAGVPLTLTYPDGGIVEIANTAANLRSLAQAGIAAGVVGRFERNNRFLLGALFGIAVMVTVLALWGLPALSTALAKRLPPTLLAAAASDSLVQLDRFIFKPTNLSEPKQAALTRRFAHLHPTGLSVYQLQFRRGGVIGANAFALPNGLVVVTDELVGIADEAHEVDAVLLHEIGHVEHRHALQMLINHAGLATLAALMFGDVNAVGTLVVALPSVLMDSSYSRTFETEADDFALAAMGRQHIPPRVFASMLDKLERCADVVPSKKQDFVAICRARLASKQTTPAAAETQTAPHSYFSTHPATAERIARFRQAVY